MVLIKSNWTQTDYDEYIKYLESFYNEKLKNFNEKLITTKYKIIGMNMAILRKMAKEIFKGDYDSFLSFVKNKYYEETLIEGFIRESTKDIKYIEEFLPKIDNWAICDSLTLKYVDEDLDSYFKYFLNYLKNDNEFYCRFGLVMLLNHYVKEKYLEIIFKHIDNIKIDYYFVNMAVAWLLCECFVKYPKITEEYFKVTKVNSFIMNKTISKIRDSYRVSNEVKEYLNIYKRKKVIL